MIMKMATLTKLNTVLVILSIMMEVTSPLCTPPDTSWTRHAPTIPPMEFKGQSTSGGCSGTNCTKPPILGDGYYGTADLNVTAAHAWNKSVLITFHFPEDVRVRGVNIYFYNIPTMNISLPNNTTLTSLLSMGVTIEGNQDFIEDNCQLCHVTLIPNKTYQGERFTIQFQFSNKSNIVWLLLTEVELCTDATIPTMGITTFTTGSIIPTRSATTVTTGSTHPTTSTVAMDTTTLAEKSTTATMKPDNTTMTDAANTTKIIIGAISAGLLVTITVVVVLAIIVFMCWKRRSLEKNMEIANTNKLSTLTTTTQNHDSAVIAEKKETVTNNSYETTYPKVHNVPPNDTPAPPSNDPETGQPASPLYAEVQKKEKVITSKDKSGTPSHDPFYTTALCQPERDGNVEFQLELASHSTDYEDLDKLMDAKRNKVKASDDQRSEKDIGFQGYEELDKVVVKQEMPVHVSTNERGEEWEFNPEHIYSAVQKKKKKKPSKETFPLIEKDEVFSDTSS